MGPVNSDSSTGETPKNRLIVDTIFLAISGGLDFFILRAVRIIIDDAQNRDLELIERSPGLIAVFALQGVAIGLRATSSPSPVTCRCQSPK